MTANQQQLIDVCETYNTADHAVRLKGCRLRYKKIGKWTWFHLDGHTKATWNYDTSQWTYSPCGSEKSFCGKGYVPNEELDYEFFDKSEEQTEFNDWFEEASYNASRPLYSKNWLDLLTAQYQMFQHSKAINGQLYPFQATD